MTCKLGSIGWRSSLLSAVAYPICLLLSACGGDGTSVANIPPPPTPTPSPSPSTNMVAETTWLDRAGTQVGTYGLLGRISSSSGSGRALAPGEFTMTVTKSGEAFSYALSGTTMNVKSPEIFWDPSANGYSFNEVGRGQWPQFLGQRIVGYHINEDGSKEESGSYDFTRGSTSVSLAGATFTYDVGNSYVAMGEWAWPVDTTGDPSKELLFVNGDRTPAAGIPVSGKATYDAHALSLLHPVWGSAVPGLTFTLTADFGQRTVATSVDQDYQHYDDGMAYAGPAIGTTAILGIHVDGSAPFNNDGTWDIPLTGSVNYSDTNAVQTPPSEPVTGSMDGAFFGPHAEAVGGTFFLNRVGGQTIIKDAFVGQQRP